MTRTSSTIRSGVVIILLLPLHVLVSALCHGAVDI